MSIERGTALVRKWSPKFGLSDCRIHVQPMREDEAKEALGQSYFDPSEEWAIIWLPPDDSLSPELLELTVLHELAHGLLWYVEHPTPATGTAVERFCNRVARLARGDFSTREQGEEEALSDPTHFDTKNDVASLDRRKWLAVVCDGLPLREREVIAMLFYEGLSLREVGERLGVSHETVRRVRDAGVERMHAYFECLDARFMEDAQPIRTTVLEGVATDGATSTD